MSETKKRIPDRGDTGNTYNLNSSVDGILHAKHQDPESREQMGDSLEPALGKILGTPWPGASIQRPHCFVLHKSSWHMQTSLHFNTLLQRLYVNVT